MTAVVASWRPDLALAVAFNADPNDPNATPVWTNQTFRLRHADSIKRGRQYELDQNQTGQPTMVLWDPDEYLNPANTAAPAPYTGNVLPYRQILMQAVWPNPCSGNLLNSGAIPTGYDPDFETTAVGQAPPNVLSFHATPLVQVATAFSGTKVVQWGVTGGSGEQVAGFTIPCVPGRAYVTSVYVRQTVANNTVVFIDSGATGTSTTTTGSYVRLMVAFVASQPTHKFWIGSITPTLSGVVSIDAVQHEQMSALNANPTFEAGVTNWTAHGGTIALSKVWQQQGLYSMLLTPDGVSGQCYAESEQVPVTANARYLVAGWVYAPNAVGSFDFGVNWYDASHTYISSSLTSISLSANSVTERDDQFTSPANAAYATVVPTINGTPSTSQKVYVDNVALYPATPSAFTTTGSVIYPVLRDYVERWPSEWDPDSAGFAGLAEITCVDGFAALQAVALNSEYRQAVLAKSPAYYWPLSEGQGATTFAEISGNNGPSLIRVDGPTGPAPTYNPGSQMDIPGEPGATGVQDYSDPAAANPTVSVLAAGLQPGQQKIRLGGSTLPQAFSMALWLSHTTDPPQGGNNQVRYGLYVYGYDAAVGYNTWCEFYFQQSNEYLTGGCTIEPFAGTGPAGLDAWQDGKPHLYVLTWTIDTNSGCTTKIYVDGNLWQTATFANPNNPPVDASQIRPATVVQLAGVVGTDGSYPTDTVGGFNGGVYSHLALWNRALSASEVSDLWGAGGWGRVNESSGSRIQRYLNGNYNGATNIDYGQSYMGISNLTQGESLLAACQDVTLSENGNFWIDSSGTVQFAARTRRYLAITSKCTFGENVAAGEIPYAGDVKFDFDPTYVYNDVTVERVGGIVAHVTDTASQKRYFPRAYQRTINVASDNETVDAADWLLNTHKDPHQRVEQITLDPASNPAIWPVVLGLEVGTRVTVKRRAKAGNAGAGLTMSADFFVESIEHGGIDMDAGTWTTTLLLSPAVGYQVGIFDDATYGRFDQTLIFGY